jgi:hypothetical protein
VSGLDLRCCFQVLLILILVVPFSNYASSTANAVVTNAVASFPTFQWKFLSDSEKAAVNASLKAIMNQRMKNVTLNIADSNGKPYTGPVQVTQNSMSFVFMVGDPDWPVEGMEPEYVALTPSRSVYVYQPSWRYVQPTETSPIDFSNTQYDFNLAKVTGSTDIHLIAGPDFPPAGDVAAWSETPPNWARSMNYSAFKQHLQNYVEALASHYKGIIWNYHLWDEANAGWSNRGWSIDQVVDIIKMEATTIRSIDPNARIYVDLFNITPETLEANKRPDGNYWTTEYFTQQLIASGVPFDYVGLEAKYGIGPASHQGGIDTLESRLKQIAKIAKPVYLWEEGFPSFIDAKYGSAHNDQCCYFWHGPPTEEKQAEYMLAEAIVTLAAYPSVVAGIRFNWLTDQLDNPSWPPYFFFRYMGVIYDNGTKKEAFYALRDFWGNLTMNTIVSSTSGVAALRGLAGDYSISVEGYEPSVVHVSEGKSNTFSLVLRSIALRDQASQMLVNVELNLTTAGGAAFQSSEAKNLLGHSFDEYQLAEQMFQSKNYTGVLQHAQKALDLIHQAQLKENQYQQQQLLTRIAEIVVAVALPVMAVGAAVYYLGKRKRNH